MSAPWRVEHRPVWLGHGRLEQPEERCDVTRLRVIDRQQMCRHLVADRRRIVAVVDVKVSLEEIDDRVVRDSGGIRFATALEIRHADDADGAPQFVEKPRFSDAGLADHGDELAASAARFVPATSQRRKLHLTPDERRRVTAGSETMRLITEYTEAPSAGVIDGVSLLDVESPI
jgi:hypothetical protein